MDDLDLLVEAPEPPKLPTPPPEETEKKPAKKDRARVERTGTGASWAFWTAAPAPKKSTKESTELKDDGDMSPPPAKKEKSPPGLSRSKSTKTPKEQDREEKKEAEESSKSSGSDKNPKAKRAEARPLKGGRGMSFSLFGPPPSAMRPKPTRRTSTAGAGSKSSSRRQSVDGSLM
jgi:hypothetical protein